MSAGATSEAQATEPHSTVVDCALLVVAYKSVSDVGALLASVPDAVGSLTWHMTVVDNWGRDGLHAMIGNDTRVTLLRSDANLGYAGGLNFALKHAPASRVTVFLNPDLTLDRDCVAALVQECTSGRNAAAVPRVLDRDGIPRPSLRREPSIPSALGETFFGDHWPNRPDALAEIVRSESAYRAKNDDIDWATGAVLAVRTDVVRAVGTWDAERFFLYSEETDFSRRIRESGHTIRFVPTASARHEGGGSGVSAPLHALLMVNKVRYFRKWHRPVPSGIFAIIVLLHCALRSYRKESRAAIVALLSRRARVKLPTNSNRP